MNAGAIAPLQMNALDDDAWDDLLSFIEERRVIPIVGPELLQVTTDRGPRLLYDWPAGSMSMSRNCRGPTRSTMWCAGSLVRAGGAKKPTCACALF